MIEILKGEFFWGIVAGLILSFFGGWVLAKFTVGLTQKGMRKTVIQFATDAIGNINEIIEQLNYVRSKSNIINHDFIALIEVELTIYGRNREHLIHLPDDIRKRVRSYMNDVAIGRAEVMNNLNRFYEINGQAERIQVEGRGPEAARVRQEALIPLDGAHKAADKFASLLSDGQEILNALKGIR